VAFSPDGEHLALTTPGPEGRGALLRVGRTAESGAAAPAPVPIPAAGWQIAHDSQKIYFLKDVVGGPSAPSGALVMADFPTGANPVVLQPRVGRFSLLGAPGGPDQGIGFLQDMSGFTGTFRILRDRARPEAAVTIDSGIDSVVVSPDLTYSFFERPYDVGNQAGFIGSNDGRGVCVLSAKPSFSAFGITFASDPRLVMWGEDAPERQAESDGWVADPEGCTGKRRFAINLAYLRGAGRGVVYGEEEGDTGVMTLKHAGFTAGGLDETAATTLGHQVEPNVAVVDERYVVFSIVRSAAEHQGLYVYGPLP
jgi:hypothetical protein